MEKRHSTFSLRGSVPRSGTRGLEGAKAPILEHVSPLLVGEELFFGDFWHT